MNITLIHKGIKIRDHKTHKVVNVYLKNELGNMIQNNHFYLDSNSKHYEAHMNILKKGLSDLTLLLTGKELKIESVSLKEMIKNVTEFICLNQKH